MEVKLNKSDPNINMQFDQDQLMQITQLINNLNGQQQGLPNGQQNISHDGNILGNDFQFQFQNLIDNEAIILSNQSNQIITSPIKLDIMQNNQLQSTQTITNLQITDQTTALQQQQQQDLNSEYHPIMVNGQPALFIPATSAMSSSLFSQMMMSSSTGNNQLDALTSVENTVQNQNSTFQAQINNNNNNAYNNITSGNMGININQVFDNSTCNGMSLMSSSEIGNTVDNNVIHNLENLNQNQIILNNNQLMSGTNGPQQVICIQPDGTITIQTINAMPTTSEQNVGAVSVSTADSKQLANGKIIKPNSVKRRGSEAQEAKTTKQKKVVYSLANSSNLANIEKIEKKTSKKQTIARISSSSKPNENVNLNQATEDSNISFSVNSTSTDTSIKLDNSQFAPSQDIEADGSDFGDGSKRRRKACDCQNCIKWKANHSTMTQEELAKKRTHNCHKCPKEYHKTSHLRAHLRAHDNYRPYKCDFVSCGKSFTRSDELKRHKRIHNDDRNFICTTCNKKFLRSDHLNKHMLVHNKPANQSNSSALLTSTLMEMGSLSGFVEDAGGEAASENDADASPFDAPCETIFKLEAS